MTRNIALTDYERQQIRKISAWLREETNPLQQAVQSVNAKVERNVSGILSPEHLAILRKTGDRLLASVAGVALTKGRGSPDHCSL